MGPYAAQHPAPILLIAARARTLVYLAAHTQSQHSCRALPAPQRLQRSRIQFFSGSCASGSVRVQQSDVGYGRPSRVVSAASCLLLIRCLALTALCSVDGECRSVRRFNLVSAAASRSCTSVTTSAASDVHSIAAARKHITSTTHSCNRGIRSSYRQRRVQQPHISSRFSSLPPPLLLQHVLPTSYHCCLSFPAAAIVPAVASAVSASCVEWRVHVVTAVVLAATRVGRGQAVWWYQSYQD